MTIKKECLKKLNENWCKTLKLTVCLLNDAFTETATIYCKQLKFERNKQVKQENFFKVKKQKKSDDSRQMLHPKVYE